MTANPLSTMPASESVMPFILLVPLVAAVLVLLGAPARRTSLAAAALNFALVLAQCALYHGKFTYTLFEVIPSMDLKFLVGLDGLSLMMLLLTSVVTLSAVWVTPKVEHGENAFYSCLLFISAGAVGAFVSFDLFFFYAFHELALIPTFLLIGIWGHGENREAAAWKITIYLAVGSFILLLGLVGLYVSLPPLHRTFDLTQIMLLAPIASSAQRWIFPLLLTGFGILISLFPFHTWAPSAYAAAPTPAAMMHAGILKKFGLYGLLRIAVPLLPIGMQHWMNVLLLLLVGNILYVGYVTIAQKRLDMMLGYSSVMHMGYIFLGISSLNVIGLSGAALMMFAHGLSIAVLFAVAGEIRARTGTMRLDELGGLARTMPFLALVFGLGMFASIGLPGFANFASEVMVFFGAFRYHALHYQASLLSGELMTVDKIPGTSVVLPAAATADHHQIATICALWGVVISAVYMLRAYRHVFLGVLRPEVVTHGGTGQTTVGDLLGSRRWALGILVAGLLIVGFRPQAMLNLITPSLSMPSATDTGANLGTPPTAQQAPLPVKAAHG